MATERVQKPIWQPSSQKKQSRIVPPSIDSQTEADSLPSPKVPVSGVKSKAERDAIRRSLFEKWAGAAPQPQSESEVLGHGGLSTETETIQGQQASQAKGNMGIEIQAKLTIGKPGDKYEQEADRVAAEVVQQMNTPASQQAGQSESVQREEMEDEDLMMKPGTSTIQRENISEDDNDKLMMKKEVAIVQREAMPDEEDELMMKPMVQLQPGGGGMAATSELETSIQQARGSGQPLSENIRQPMEQAFGADFSSVKVHTDTQSDQLNQSIQARAFTTGQDIFFRQGEYDTGSRGGQELIAHELTHVVQQNSSTVYCTTIQRLPDLDTFKQQTYLVGTVRLNVKPIDREITAYHALPMSNYADRVSGLKRIQQECRTYLEYSDEKAKRKAGVKWLLPQVMKELEIFEKLVDSEAVNNLQDKYRRIIEAQNLKAEAEVLGYEVSNVGSHIYEIIDLLIIDMRTNEPDSLTVLINDDLDALNAMQNDPTLPDLTRRVISEVLANRGITRFEQGVPGAKLILGGTTSAGEKYNVTHSLNQGLGTTERLGSLTHELTHVSSGESFNNTKAFLLYDTALTADQVVALAQARVTKVQRLEALYRNDQAFSNDQKALLASKINYAKESKVGLYGGKFDDASKERLKTDPNDPVGIQYRMVSDQLLAVSKAVPVGNSTLIEYDTVMNQMLIYMHMWHIPQNNQFYTELRRVAEEAAQARANARVPAVPNVSP